MTAKNGSSERKKVNFMIDKNILIKLQTFVLPGERSDFVNKALDEAIISAARKQASEATDAFRKANKWKLSMDEFRRLKNYGRK